MIQFNFIYILINEESFGQKENNIYENLLQ